MVQVREKPATSSASRAYDVIRTMAVEYTLRPGERINEVELARRLAISRTPLREALNRLVNEGLITLEPNRGFRCRTLDTREVYNLFEVRGGLEQVSVRLAAERADNAELAEFQAFWRRTEEEAETLSAVDLAVRDEAFHERIAALSGNPELLSMLRGLNVRLRFVRRIVIEMRDREGVFADHRRIAAALKARNVERALREMKQHVGLTLEDAVSIIKESLARIYMQDANSVAAG